MRIILASKSKARKKILEDCGFKVDIAAPKIEESDVVMRSFSHTVKTNALKKIKYAAKMINKGVIIAADTLVFRDKFVFGKPKSLKEAKVMLNKLSQNPHWVYTGIAVLDKSSNNLELDYEKTKVIMHKLSEKEINSYVKENRPLNFAGAFDIQGRGGLYIRRIEGCFYNVVGLPLAKLYEVLKKMNLIVILFIFSLGLIGCTEFNPVTQKQEMILYSTEKEVSIGRNVASQVEKEYEPVKDPRVIERINKIVEKIIAVCDRKDIDYYVRAIAAKDEEKKEGADINAFALPGGYIFVYDGLINFVDNDDELACVIAHEVGHVAAKHSIKKLQGMMGYNLLAIAAMGTGDAQLAKGANYAFLNILLGYSREDELLADKLGARYAKEAGFDPKAMIVFLEKLREKQRKDPIRQKSIYRTHPYVSDRIAEIKRELGEPLTFKDYINITNE